MKTIVCAALALLVPVLSHAGGADLRRAEKQLTSQCKSVGSTPIEFFELTCSTCVLADRKEISLTSSDVAYSTNSILIHATSSISQTQAFPHRGLTAFVKQASAAVRFFVSRSVSEFPSTITVCGMQLE